MAKNQKQNNSSSLISRCYEKIIKLLQRRFFRYIAAVFSHGATHLIFLLLIGIAIVYLWRKNNQENITPHSLSVSIGYLSADKEELKKKELINNVSINVLLNSDKIKQITQGMFSNGVDVEFDGKTIKHIVHTIQKSTSPLIPPKISETSYLDSIVVTLSSDPPLRSVFSNGEINPYLGEEEVFDSITNERRTVVYVAKDTKPDYTIATGQNSVTAYIAPKTYNVGNTRHKVRFISDEIGVKKDDPYYYYFISFPKFYFSGDLTISFNVSDNDNKGDVVNYKGINLQYNYIYPEPDEIGNGKISYFTKEKKEMIQKNKGVIIQAVDIEAQNRHNRYSFLFSVLIGTGFAFMLDIIIQLIRELRRLQVQKRNNDDTK